MSERTAYRQLADIYGFPGSARLERILALIMSEDEARWLAQLPATPGQLAERQGCTASHAEETLQRLVSRGFAYPGEATPTGTLFHRFSVGALADWVLADARYESLGAEFYDAWKAFYNEELIQAQSRQQLEHPETPYFRIIPAEGALPAEGVLEHERASWIVRQARRIGVMHCPCRRRERRCDHEHEVCLAFDDLAEFSIRKGVHREISTEEALAILTRCEQKGLVHSTENMEVPRLLCNCCPCCCVFLRPRTTYGLDLPIATSRYHVVWDEARCTHCGLCLERCHFGALVAGPEPPAVHSEQCVGCGLCVIACPEGALALATEQPEIVLRSEGTAPELTI